MSSSENTDATAEPSSTTSSHDIEIAEKLKEEGNGLHAKAKYRAAYEKYTEAIKHNPNSAILFANRAASSIALKEYLDASHDARKSIELDPKYTKAYARLGAASKAIGSFTVSIEAWKNGLATLPPDSDLSEAQKRLQEQLKAGLIETERTQKARANTPNERVTAFPVGPETDTKLPWLRAQDMSEELFETENTKSSAWVIMNALPGFEQGMDKIDKVEEFRENGEIRFSGKLGALLDITNALLRDIRIFHCTRDFFDKIGKQVKLEMQVYHGWPAGGSKTVQESALARLKATGWDDVRTGLDITVRAWILQGFLANSAGQRQSAHQFYRQALDILEWGIKEWADVPEDDKGFIFHGVFTRNVRRLWMGTVMELCKEGRGDYTYDDLEKIARDMIEDVDNNPHPVLLLPTGRHDYGAYLAWWTYPKAEAYSMIGWCHMQRAVKAKSKDGQQDLFQKSFDAYMESTNLFPEDDEHHLYFLEVALTTRWLTDAPLKETLPICKRIRVAMPKMLRIWEFSAMSKRRDPPLHRVIEFEADVQKALLNRLVTMDQSFNPGLIKAYLAEFETPAAPPSSKSKKKKGRK